MSSRGGQWSVPLFALMLVFIVAISIGADLRLLPLHLIAFPNYDKLGHFVLYGLLGFLLHLTLHLRAPHPGHVRLPYAIPIIVLFAVLDELQQRFLPARSFDAIDFAADLIGILFFVGIAEIVIRAKLTESPRGLQ